MAKSKEYSELNNVASVAGMKFTYSKMLDKYFDDDPRSWAERLRNALDREPIMYKYLVDPTPGVSKDTSLYFRFREVRVANG